jgi:hypothetical protein
MDKIIKALEELYTKEYYSNPNDIYVLAIEDILNGLRKLNRQEASNYLNGLYTAVRTISKNAM